jgi:hypothetical protein
MGMALSGMDSHAMPSDDTGGTYAHAAPAQQARAKSMVPKQLTMSLLGVW